MNRHLHSMLRLIAVMILCATFLPTPGYALSSIDLAVHYVEGMPADGQKAYDVNAYLSVLDVNGNPIKDLEVEDLSITEDSQTVQINTLNLVGADPISVVLVLSTSQLMSGQAITAARAASTSFVASMDATDPMAVITFNDRSKTLVDFTTDHQDVQDELAHVDTVNNTGACLYDAIYQAVQMTAGLTSGQRAIVVLTNSEDETLNGGKCSSMTVDDVINAASAGGMRVPIFTIGLGAQVDEQELERISTLTGGRYHYAINTDELDPLMLRISSQFNSQYMLNYTSYAPAGAHTLAVKVDYSKAQDQDTRNFILPPFPTRVAFTSPVEGQELGGTVLVAVQVSGDGQPATQVTFEINGETAATAANAPFEAEIDFDAYPEGSLAITAIAQAADGTELARTTENVTVNYAAAVEDEKKSISILGALGIAAAVFAGLVLVVIIVLARSRSKKKKKQPSRSIPQNWTQNQTVGEVRVAQPVVHAPPAAMGNSDATMIDAAPTALMKASVIKAGGAETLGTLIVEASDDSTVIGHRFDLTKPLTTIGRSADNDINFPKDSPISRQHAQIEARNDGLLLCEVQNKDDSGVIKSPTFGTFVNETALPASGVILHNGDSIRLGKRVRLKFETQHSVGGTAQTPDDLDKTIA